MQLEEKIQRSAEVATSIQMASNSVTTNGAQDVQEFEIDVITEQVSVEALQSCAEASRRLHEDYRQNVKERKETPSSKWIDTFLTKHGITLLLAFETVCAERTFRIDMRDKLLTYAQDMATVLTDIITINQLAISQCKPPSDKKKNKKKMKLAQSHRDNQAHCYGVAAALYSQIAQIHIMSASYHGFKADRHPHDQVMVQTLYLAAVSALKTGAEKCNQQVEFNQRYAKDHSGWKPSWDALGIESLHQIFYQAFRQLYLMLVAEGDNNIPTAPAAMKQVEEVAALLSEQPTLNSSMSPAQQKYLTVSATVRQELFRLSRAGERAVNILYLKHEGLAFTVDKGKSKNNPHYQTILRYITDLAKQVEDSFSFVLLMLDVLSGIESKQDITALMARSRALSGTLDKRYLENCLQAMREHNPMIYHRESRTCFDIHGLNTYYLSLTQANIHLTNATQLLKQKEIAQSLKVFAQADEKLVENKVDPHFMILFRCTAAQALLTTINKPEAVALALKYSKHIMIQITHMQGKRFFACNAKMQAHICSSMRSLHRLMTERLHDPSLGEVAKGELRSYMRHFQAVIDQGGYYHTDLENHVNGSTEVTVVDASNANYQHISEINAALDNLVQVEKHLSALVSQKSECEQSDFNQLRAEITKAMAVAYRYSKGVLTFSTGANHDMPTCLAIEKISMKTMAVFEQYRRLLQQIRMQHQNKKHILVELDHTLAQFTLEQWYTLLLLATRKVTLSGEDRGVNRTLLLSKLVVFRHYAENLLVLAKNAKVNQLSLENHLLENFDEVQKKIIMTYYTSVSSLDKLEQVVRNDISSNLMPIQKTISGLIEQIEVFAHSEKAKRRLLLCEEQIQGLVERFTDPKIDFLMKNLMASQITVDAFFMQYRQASSAMQATAHFLGGLEFYVTHARVLAQCGKLSPVQSQCYVDSIKRVATQLNIMRAGVAAERSVDDEQKHAHKAQQAAILLKCVELNLLLVNFQLQAGNFRFMKCDSLVPRSSLHSVRVALLQQQLKLYTDHFTFCQMLIDISAHLDDFSRLSVAFVDTKSLAQRSSELFSHIIMGNVVQCYQVEGGHCQLPEQAMAALVNCHNVVINWRDQCMTTANERQQLDLLLDQFARIMPGSPFIHTPVTCRIDPPHNLPTLIYPATGVVYTEFSLAAQVIEAVHLALSSVIDDVKQTFPISDRKNERSAYQRIMKRCSTELARLPQVDTLDFPAVPVYLQSLGIVATSAYLRHCHYATHARYHYCLALLKKRCRSSHERQATKIDEHIETGLQMTCYKQPHAFISLDYLTDLLLLKVDEIESKTGRDFIFETVSVVADIFLCRNAAPRTSLSPLLLEKLQTTLSIVEDAYASARAKNAANKTLQQDADLLRIMTDLVLQRVTLEKQKIFSSTNWSTSRNVAHRVVSPPLTTAVAETIASPQLALIYRQVFIEAIKSAKSASPSMKANNLGDIYHYLDKREVNLLSLEKELGKCGDDEKYLSVFANYLADCMVTMPVEFDAVVRVLKTGPVKKSKLDKLSTRLAKLTVALHQLADSTHVTLAAQLAPFNVELTVIAFYPTLIEKMLSLATLPKFFSVDKKDVEILHHQLPYQQGIGELQGLMQALSNEILALNEVLSAEFDKNQKYILPLFSCLNEFVRYLFSQLMQNYDSAHASVDQLPSALETSLCFFVDTLGEIKNKMSPQPSLEFASALTTLQGYCHRSQQFLKCHGQTIMLEYCRDGFVFPTQAAKLVTKQDPLLGLAFKTLAQGRQQYLQHLASLASHSSKNMTQLNPKQRKSIDDEMMSTYENASVYLGETGDCAVEYFLRAPGCSDLLSARECLAIEMNSLSLLQSVSHLVESNKKPALTLSSLLATFDLALTQSRTLGERDIALTAKMLLLQYLPHTCILLDAEQTQIAAYWHDVVSTMTATPVKTYCARLLEPSNQLAQICRNMTAVLKQAVNIETLQVQMQTGLEQLEQYTQAVAAHFEALCKPAKKAKAKTKSLPIKKKTKPKNSINPSDKGLSLSSRSSVTDITRSTTPLSGTTSPSPVSTSSSLDLSSTNEASDDLRDQSDSFVHLNAFVDETVDVVDAELPGEEAVSEQGWKTVLSKSKQRALNNQKMDRSTLQDSALISENLSLPASSLAPLARTSYLSQADAASPAEHSPPASSSLRGSDFDGKSWYDMCLDEYGSEEAWTAAMAEHLKESYAKGASTHQSKLNYSSTLFASAPLRRPRSLSSPPVAVVDQAWSAEHLPFVSVVDLAEQAVPPYRGKGEPAHTVGDGKVHFMCSDPEHSHVLASSAKLSK